MSNLNHETIAEITALLREGKRTTKQLAFVLGKDQQGVASCLRGMRNRGEVTRSITAPGKPAVWRLTA